MSIRVLIADDQEIIRAGFRVLLETAPDIEVVGEAADGREAVDLARSLRAHVVLMDIRMPVLDGLAATRLISADEELADVRVLVLTTFELDEYVFQALRAGAGGFIGKGIAPRELIDAVRTIAAGDALLSPRATQGLISRFLAQPDPHRPQPIPDQLEALTSREREIVALVAEGMSNIEIARHLHLAESTVKTHVNRAMAKLSARDRAQLVVVAFHAGLAGPSALH